MAEIFRYGAEQYKINHTKSFVIIVKIFGPPSPTPRNWPALVRRNILMALKK